MPEVGFVQPRHPSTEGAAAWQWLATIDLESRPFTPREAIRDLAGLRLLWWHDAEAAAPRLRPAEADQLREWLNQGGRLLLSLQAATLLQALGLEDRPPDVLGSIPWEHSTTELSALEGERRGAIGFGPHPVFDGLHTGVVLIEPGQGAVYPEAVYSTPVHGRLVAVEWQYLALDASRRIVLEHQVGRGRVLTVGAHLLFGASPNPYRGFLERFARNCLDYLLAERGAGADCYWPATQPAASHSGLGGDIARVDASAPLAQAGERLLVSDGPGEAQFDVAGRRIVVLGRYQAGVAEIWSLPVRLAREVRASFDGAAEAASAARVRITPAGVERTLHMAAATVVQSIATDGHEATVRYELMSGTADSALIEFTVDLRYFWPYPDGVLGQPRVERRDSEMLMLDGQGTRRGAFRFEPRPDDLTLLPAAGGLRVSARFHRPQALQVSFHGPRFLSTYDVEPLLEIETPDRDLNQALFWAMNGLRAFDVESPVGRGLVAGFAETGTGWWAGRLGYAWYFGRDMMWSSSGCLAVGLRQAVAGSLRLLTRYQQLDGKIFHELTPTGVAHFTAADSTPLFLVGLERYLRWTGDLELIRELWPHARRALAFCFSTDRDGDGLIENTGVGHGWSEGGRVYGAHATFYLNACWAAALQASMRLARLMHDAGTAHRCQAAARHVTSQLNRRFYRPADGWFAYGLARDGSMMDTPTMEPAVAALFGLLEPDLLWRFFDELAGDRFTTPWGVRYVARDDPAYHPRGYHHGSVWPLFTGWAAAAEYAYGRAGAAYNHVRSSLELTRRGSLGTIDEVLDGDDGSSAGVCQHQLWSHAMTVAPVVEGLLGIQPEAHTGRLLLRPQIPPEWDRVHVRGLRVGEDTLSFTYERAAAGLSIRLDEPGSGRLRVDFRPE